MKRSGGRAGDAAAGRVVQSQDGGAAMTATRTTRLAMLLLPASLLALSAAGPPAADTPDDLIRRGNAAFAAGDAAAADALYAAAEERACDPGLVAFNRAAVLFGRGEFRDAESHYARALDDAACPPGRAARAWYNRGTCLVRRGGGAAVFRSAVACFERCLDLGPGDDTLAADARHNLELAKLLWIAANATAAKPDPPGAAPEEQSKPPAPAIAPTAAEPKSPEGGPEKGTSNQPPADPKPVHVATGSQNDQGAPVAGNSAALPVLADSEQTQPLSPEDTRAYLKLTADRLRRERHSLLRTPAGRGRPDVRDW